MTRLYDGSARGKQQVATRDAARERAKLDALLQEVGEADEASARLSEKLGRQAAVQKIVYTHFRPKGSLWQLEYASVGDDLVVQCFPLKPERVDWQAVITRMIGAVDAIVGRTVVVKYAPPQGPMNGVSMPVKFYTIRFLGCRALPGWERAQAKILEALVRIDAWH